MPKLRNEVTGVVVSVSDGTAAQLGPEWVPIEVPKQTRKKKQSSK